MQEENFAGTISVGDRFRPVGGAWTDWQVVRLVRFHQDPHLYAVMVFRGEMKVLAVQALLDPRRYQPLPLQEFDVKWWFAMLVRLLPRCPSSPRASGHPC